MSPWNWSPARRPSETPRPCAASPGRLAAGSRALGGRRPAGRFRCGSDPTSAWRIRQWQLRHGKKTEKMWRSQEHPKTIQKHLHMILKELKVTMREVIFVRMMNWGILPGRTFWTRFNTSQGRGQEELNTNTYESIELCRWPSSRRGSNNKYDKLPARNPRNYQIGLDAFPKNCKLVMVASWDLLRVY